MDSLDDISLSISTAHERIAGARNQRDAGSIDGLIRSYPLQADLEKRGALKSD